MYSISEERRQQRPEPLSMDEKQSNGEKILGVQWDTVADSFGYKINLKEYHQKSETIRSLRNERC